MANNKTSIYYVHHSLPLQFGIGRELPIQVLLEGILLNWVELTEPPLITKVTCQNTYYVDCDYAIDRWLICVVHRVLTLYVRMAHTAPPNQYKLPDNFFTNPTSGGSL